MMRQDVLDPLTFRAEPSYLSTYVEETSTGYTVSAVAWNGHDLEPCVLSTGLTLPQALAVAQVPS